MLGIERIIDPGDLVAFLIEQVIRTSASLGGGVGHPIGIFDGRCRRFPRAAVQEATPQGLAAGDQAVVAVGRRKRRQEGERCVARLTNAAPNNYRKLTMSLRTSGRMRIDTNSGCS